MPRRRCRLATLVPGGDGLAETTLALPADGATVSVRYHPEGCTGPENSVTLD